MGNGKVLEGLPIAVDYWKLPKMSEKFKTYLYFLTHMHTDHTQGLTSTWNETIYTSCLNRDLLIAMLNVRPEIIKVMEVGVTYKLSLPQEHGNKKSSSQVSVTPIDANHIKGSVMFLFEGSFGKILYTGDFRWCNSMKQNPILKNLADSRDLNLMYVDNTFEAVGSEFPTRQQCMAQVLDIVKKHRYHRIIFGVQTIGKEDVLVKAAIERQQQIYVPGTIRKIYCMLGVPEDLLSTNQSDCFLWYESTRRITEFDLQKKNQDMPTIAIALTASEMLYSNKPARNNEGSGLVYTVHYSNHCCASELSKFLHFLQPARVEPIVQPSTRKKPTQSVIALYLAEKSAELSSDMEGTTNGFYDELYYKDQEVPPNVETEEMSEVIPSPSFHSVPSSPPEKESQSLSDDDDTELKSVIRQARELIAVIHSELDSNDPEHIYSTGFIGKLRSLTELYRPVTGVSLES